MQVISKEHVLVTFEDNYSCHKYTNERRRKEMIRWRIIVVKNNLISKDKNNVLYKGKKNIL